MALAETNARSPTVSSLFPYHFNSRFAADQVDNYEYQSAFQE